MSPENQADYEVAPAARFVETRPFRASPDGRDGLFDRGCCFTRGPSPLNRQQQIAKERLDCTTGQPFCKQCLPESSLVDLRRFDGLTG